MKKVILIVLALFSVNIFGQTANWIWGKYAKTGRGEGTSVAIDRSFNVVSVGYTHAGENVFDTDTIPYSGLTGIFVVKYNSTGKVLWAKGFDGNGSDHAWDVAIDKNNNIYVVGDFGWPQIIFGNDTFYNNGGFILKLDSLGNLKWALNSNGGPNSIATDKYNNLYISGTFGGSLLSLGSQTISSSYPGLAQTYLAKISSAGNVIWLRNFGGDKDEHGSSVSTDKLGNIYVSGFYTSSSFTFASNTLINSNPLYEDIFLVKYNSLGNEVWGKTYGSLGNDRVFGLASDSIGNTYLSGNFGSLTLTLGTFSFTNSGKVDGYIFKSDSMGNVIWAKHESGSQDDVIGSVSVDQHNYVYLQSGFGYPILDTVTIGTTVFYPPSNSFDPTLVAKLDSSGNIICSNVLPTGGQLAGGNAVDLDGNCFFTSGANITPFIIAGDTLNGTLGPYIMTAKWNCGVYSGFIDIEQQKSEGTIIFPNPTSSIFFISPIENDYMNSEIEILNYLGQIVLKTKFKSEIDVSELQNGVYILRLKNSQNHIAIKRFVVSK